MKKNVKATKPANIDTEWSLKGKVLKEALEKHLRELKEADENYKRILE